MTEPWPLGHVLGGAYRVERELGSGGMGHVYLAHDLQHDRKVALKILRAEFTVSLSAERFMREIRVIARLSHKNIIGLIGSGEAEGRLYYVMPFMEGETLQERLRRDTRLTVEDALQITAQMCDALSYAHRRGVVHRDVKPANILLASRTHALLGDFGLAHAVHIAANVRITPTGMSLGSPLYMSPEQAAGEREIDGRSDIYSLAVVLFEMLSGEPPFSGGGVESLFRKKRTEAPPSLRRLVPEVSSQMEAALRTALAPKVGARFDTADDFCAALSDPSARKRQRISARGVLAGALGAAVVGAGIYAAFLMSRSGTGNGTVPRDRLILADFSTQPLDTLLSHLVTETLRVDLSQSQVVSVVESQRVNDALKRMARPNRGSLAYPDAREVAVREGIPVVVTGEITRAPGRDYVLTARLVSTGDERTLAAARAVARDSTELIRAIDRLSGSLRAAVGETVRSLDASVPLEQVTTSSLEALRKYSQATRALDNEGDYLRAAALLEDAIAADTAFAMAYRVLGILLANQGGQEARSLTLKARGYALRDRLSEKERYLTAATYLNAIGDFGGAITAYRNVLELWPDNTTALNNLGSIYTELAEFGRAEEVLARAFELNPDAAIILSNLVKAQFDNGKRSVALETHDRYRKLFPTNPRALEYSLALAAATEDYVAAEAHARALRAEYSSDPRWRIDSSRYLGDLAAVRGQLTVAETHWREAMREQVGRGTPRGYLVGATEIGRLDLLTRGDSAAALARMRTALREHPLSRLAPADRPYVDLAVLYADAGRPREARALLADMVSELGTQLPYQTQRRGREISSAVYLAEGRAREALTELELVRPEKCRMCPTVRMGHAYEQLGLPDSAIAAYERYVATPVMLRLEGDRFWLAPVHERLSELLEQKGDSARAVFHARRLFELWRGADPRLNGRLEVTRQRMARLAPSR